MPTDAPASIDAWRAAYLGGASVARVLGGHLEHVGRTTPGVAWIHRAPASELADRLDALEQLAASCLDRRELLRRYPLFGVPFAVKDNIDVAGWPTTAACPAWSRVAQRSATVVQRLLDAGAVLLGKTNLDQFATGLVGTRSPYGAPVSAFAADRISGGSSSGSAVVVARGDVAFALGTDTAGSGRVPAGFNHLVGLKPTPGRVSTAGVLPACRTLDCVSIFALRADDAALVLSLIEGEDEADDYTRASAGPSAWTRPLRIGVPADPAIDDRDGYPAAWRTAVARLDALGATALPVDFAPLHRVAALLYDGPWVAERYAVVQSLLDATPEALDPTVAAVIGRARGLSAVDTFRAQYALQHARRTLAALWSRVDLLMVPTAPLHPRFDEVAADPIGVNSRLGTYTNFVNLLGWSALAMPAGFADGGLPFGVTFVAPGDADAALADWGMQWQAALHEAAPLPLGATAERWRPMVSGERPAPRCHRRLPIAVVGAHLSGLPLNGQLTERGATLRERTTTAPCYRLYELPATTPPKPGLVRVGDGGAAIDVEVWEMPEAAVGSFLALVPPPLALGSVVLADGRTVHGFLCEPVALPGATDITASGGWRAWLARRGAPR